MDEWPKGWEAAFERVIADRERQGLPRCVEGEVALGLIARTLRDMVP